MKLVVIITKGRSGALFLQSLLDSHPRFFSIPSHILRSFYNGWFSKYEYEKIDNLILKFIEDHDFLFNKTNQQFIEAGFVNMGQNQDENISVNKQVFFQNFKKLCKKTDSLISRREFFIKLHQTYAKTIDQDIRKVDTIIYYLHDYEPKLAPQILNDFPETKFIHLMRKPLQTTFSLIHHLYSRNIFEHKRNYAIIRCFRNLLWIFPLREDCFNISCFIKLEDLHSNPRIVMEKLSNFIGIEWNDCLLKSTLNGKLWWNFSTGINVIGFNKQTTKKNRFEHLSTKFDRIRLSSILMPFYVLFEYDTQEYETKENINKYIALLFVFFYPFKFEILGFRSSDWGQIDKNKSYNYINKLFFVFKNFINLRILLLKIFLLIHYGFKPSKKPNFIKFIDLKKNIIPFL